MLAESHIVIYKNKEWSDILNNKLKYSLELAMLSRLKSEDLLNEIEYIQIKQKLMHDHKVVSNLV